MADESSKYNSTFQNEVKGAVVGEGNIIYNYFYYREEVKPVDSAIAVDEYLPCPYRGLFHFGPNDADVFFGREIFIEKLYSTTQTRNFIPVLGASGSGKSSVVLAGLVPKLQKTGYWKFTHFRPGSVPFYALAEALIPLYTPELDHTDQIAQTRKLAGYLFKNEVSLTDVFRKIQQNHPNHRVLLIADQFEEIYTLCSNPGIRRKFLDCLLASLESPDLLSSSATVLVTTMRADFLGNALSYRPFADVLQNADVKLGPMNREELTQVIEKPAQKLGVTFETGLVERILDDVENQPGNLPLLEFALTELWNKRSGKQLTHKIYEEIGQVEGALARHADEKYGNLTDDEKEKVRRIFIQLVRPGEGAEDTRRVAMKAELGEQSWSLVKKLADARLVVTSRNLASQETVEVVHEALIHNWRELREWMNTNRVFRAWQERLRSAKGQWEATNKDSSSLLRGAALAEAEERLKERSEDLIDEKEFIEQSIKERNRLKRLQFITVFSTTVVLVGFSMFAGYQWRQAEIQKIRALRESSEALLISNQQLEALVNSLQAGKSLNHPLLKVFSSNDIRTEVTKSLRKAFYQVKERNSIKKPIGSLVSITPDGQIMVAENIKEPLKYLLDSEGNRVIPFPGFQAALNPVNYSPGIIYSPDGRFIAIADIDDAPWNKDKYGTVSMWDSQTNTLTPFTRHRGGVKSISFSPNSKKIATVDGNNTVYLWDIESKDKIQEFKDYSDKNIVGIGFDPNNELLIATADKNENKLSIWSSENHQKLHELSGSSDTNKDFSRVIFSSDGKRIVIQYGWKPTYHTDESRAIKFFLWNYLEDKPLSLLDLESLPLEDDDIFMAMSHDGKQLATALNNSNVARFWGLESKVLEWSEISQKAISVSLSADGKKLATVNQDGTVGLWDLESQKFTPISVITDNVKKVSVSADGKKLATANQDGTVGLWDLESKNSLRLIKRFSNGDMVKLKKIEEIIKVDFSPDSNKLVFVSKGVDQGGSSASIVSLWNLRSKKIQLEKEIVSFDVVIFNVKNELLFINTDGLEDITRFFDLNKNEVLKFKYGSPCPIYNDQNSSNSEKSGLIASTKDDKVCLWDVEGNYLASFKVPQGKINDISFNSAGSLMAIAVDNGSILLWNIGELDELMTWGCNWIQDYLKTNPNVNESNRHLCDGIGKK
ncbi:WD40 repeat domain-containing protein [Nostoc sp. CHAB 5844]|nr:WD40 repeat domain-containing protein [Nostoc sp. CHAB 5844]